MMAMSVPSQPWSTARAAGQRGTVTARATASKPTAHATDAGPIRHSPKIALAVLYIGPRRLWFTIAQPTIQRTDTRNHVTSFVLGSDVVHADTIVCTIPTRTMNVAGTAS